MSSNPFAESIIRAERKRQREIREAVRREEKKWRDRGWYGRYVSEEEMAEFYKNNPGAERL